MMNNTITRSMSLLPTLNEPRREGISDDSSYMDASEITEVDNECFLTKEKRTGINTLRSQIVPFD